MFSSLSKLGIYLRSSIVSQEILVRFVCFFQTDWLPSADPLGLRYLFRVGSVPSILIVDDSSDDVLLLKRAFKKTGVANPIYCVNSGREAIAYLKGVPPYDDRRANPLPGVILLDLQMPDGDGFEVLQWIRKKYPSGGLLVVVLTRIEELRKINRAYALGANSFLTKPGNPEELNELIRIFSGYWLLTNRPPQTPSGETNLDNYAQ
jgi:CheY-like chemotaxis protein